MVREWREREGDSSSYSKLIVEVELAASYDGQQLTTEHYKAIISNVERGNAGEE